MLRYVRHLHQALPYVFLDLVQDLHVPDITLLYT